MTKKAYRDYQVIKNHKLSSSVYEISLRALDGLELDGGPGQFVMVRLNDNFDPILGRPLGICDIEGDVLTLIYEVVGRGTQILSRKREKDQVKILGPLGSSFPILENKRLALVAGGAGIAPMRYVARLQKNCQIDLYAGYRSEVFGAEGIEAYVDRVYLATEDGSQGHKGFAIDNLRVEDYDYIFSCGPSPMTQALDKLIAGRTQAYYSLESRMACGIGACAACSCKTKGGQGKVCKDGPVFSAQEVVFNG